MVRDLPELIRCIKLNETFMEVKCDFSIALQLSDYFSFYVENYQHMPKFKAGGWDGRVKLFSPYHQLLFNGLIPYLKEFAETNGHQFEVDPELLETDETITDAALADFYTSLNLPFPVRDYQNNAIRETLRTKRTTLESSVASGKSYIIYLIIRYLLIHKQRKCLLIVPTVDLVHQMYGDFEFYSEMNGFNVEQNCHMVFAGQEKLTDAPIVISTWQSLQKVPDEYFEQFGAVFADEVHEAKEGKVFGEVLKKCFNAEYRVGTTGTMDGIYVNKLVLEGLLGKHMVVAKAHELIERGILSKVLVKVLVLQFPDDTCKVMKDYTYVEEKEFLTYLPERNNFICNFVKAIKGNTLLMFRNLAHGKLLNDLLSQNCPDKKVYLIYGDVPSEVRTQVRKIAEVEKNVVILATDKLFSRGINIRNLYNLIFASPSKSRVQTIQSIGRTLRMGDDSDKVYVYDICDLMKWKSRNNHMLNHFEFRATYYNNERFPYKMYSFNMKCPAPPKKEKEKKK